MSSYDSAVLADGPVFYLTGTTTDQGTGGHTVTTHGSPATAATLPNGDAAWVLDSTGTQYLQAGDADDLSVITTGALTAECWINPAAVIMPHFASTGYVNFLSKAGFWTPPGSNQYEWELRYFNQDTTDLGNAGESLCGYAFTALSGGIGSGFDDAAGVTPGTWICTAVVYDCTASPSRVSIYRNGTQVNTTTFTGTPQNGTAPLSIGAGETAEGSPTFWYGSIGKVAVYPKVLTPNHLAAHYQAMTGAAKFTGGAVRRRRI